MVILHPRNAYLIFVVTIIPNNNIYIYRKNTNREYIDELVLHKPFFSEDSAAPPTIIIDTIADLQATQQVQDSTNYLIQYYKYL